MLDKTCGETLPGAWRPRRRSRPELESYDEYNRVITQLDPQTRVIACKDGIQWIVQHLRIRRGSREWLGVSFCRTKEALLRCVPWRSAEHPALQALPDRFPEASPTTQRSPPVRQIEEALS